jgi:hypothetical protein
MRIHKFTRVYVSLSEGRLALNSKYRTRVYDIVFAKSKESHHV